MKITDIIYKPTAMLGIGWVALAWLLTVLAVICLMTGCVSTGHGGAGLFVGGQGTNGNYSFGAYTKTATATNVWKISTPINPAAAIQALFPGVNL